MSDFLNNILDTLKDIARIVINWLPDSPFHYLTLNETVNRYLGYVNWILPLNEMIAVMEVWLTAVVLYIVIQPIIRLIKAVE